MLSRGYLLRKHQRDVRRTLFARLCAVHAASPNGIRNETGDPKAACREERLGCCALPARSRELLVTLILRSYSSLLAFGAIAEAGSFSSTLSTRPYESISCAVSQLLRSQSAVIFSID